MTGQGPDDYGVGTVTGRPTFLAVLVAVAVSGLLAQAYYAFRPAPPPMELFGLAVDKREIRLGRVPVNSRQNVVFSLTNHGSEPLYIQTVRTDCSCVAPDIPQQPIAPGRSHDLAVSVKLRDDVGPFARRVVLEFGPTANKDDSDLTAQYVLTIAGQAEGGQPQGFDALTAIPSIIDFGAVAAGERRVKKVLIKGPRGILDELPSVIALTVGDEPIVVEVSTTGQGDALASKVIEFSLAEMPSARNRSHEQSQPIAIECATSDARFELPVRYRLRPEIEAFPSQLLLTASPGSAEASGTITLRRADERPLKYVSHFSELNVRVQPVHGEDQSKGLPLVVAIQDPIASINGVVELTFAESATPVYLPVSVISRDAGHATFFTSEEKE